MIINNDLDVVNNIKNVFERFNMLEDLNDFLRIQTGIVNFFDNLKDRDEFKIFIKNIKVTRKIKADLGDFQTPSHLTDKICNFLVEKDFIPEVILEPTCGSGEFIVSAIKCFPKLKYIYCVEIQPEYEKLFKLNLLKLSFDQKINSVIEFHRDNIFTHIFSKSFLDLLKSDKKKFLILGNPPWITNSQLSILNSFNLPSKFNIKKTKGIDAITGSSNFDISEFIITDLIQQFSFREGQIAMLCKTTVVKNLLKDMDKLGLKLSNIQNFSLDSNKEFNISADAALFHAQFGTKTSDFCTLFSFYTPTEVIKKYGWVKDKFVSNIEKYDKYKELDGISVFEWRQGVKHDATKVMILKTNKVGSLLNGFNEIVEIEEVLLYPFLKGSSLRELAIKTTQYKIILTQTSLNQDTTYIKDKYPKTWSYLNSYSEKLNGRKSQIYKNSNKFSIFGIGDYSFKPFKIGIAGLYKEPIFSLILPIDNKSIMLDDTCYQLAFERFEMAFFTWILLNFDITKEFLNSIVFLDAKRPYTKKILMRINFSQLIRLTTYQELKKFYDKELMSAFPYDFTEEEYLEYLSFYKNKA